jgi:hypothetical protein
MTNIILRVSHSLIILNIVFWGFLVCWQYSTFVGYMSLILWTCFYDVCIAQFSVLGSNPSYGGIVGSSYMMVSAFRWVIICESGKGPLWELGL